MNTVTIEIAGNTYTIRTDDTAEYMKDLASQITIKMLEIKRDTGASSADCAVIAALDFADRYNKELQKKKAPSRKKDLPDPLSGENSLI